MEVKQLEMLLKALQIFTSSQLVEVTFEGVIKMKMVQGFGL